ncbi:hypothetical protein HH310_34235 [Actinoplanes sp. TBRC 11911]|uniref:hypothetical protein n=1 Tax=Actinoplanes sp. TBRC 11911 TaxID=2729386 RepID=UPI00145D27C0|nr:hypothetical protein [Actinoplanes sp. TBRC 11911]NMO56224.1 hypothetical protein [Actinoplanes sp. TBRC 11911]
MKRIMASAAAATLLAAGTATPALAAPPPMCIETGDSCVTVDEIGENSEIYVGQKPDGSMQGFTGFADFADWAGDTYGISMSLRGGSIHVDLASAGNGRGDGDNGDDSDSDDSGNGNRGGGDGDNDGRRGDNGDRHGDRHGNRHGNGHGDDRLAWSARKAQFTTFYDRPNLSGPSFVVAPNDTVDDLNDLRKPGGGDWNNEISSVRVVGGNAGSPGAVLCARVSCKKGGWVLILNNSDETQLVGGFANSASFVGVFAG